MKKITVLMFISLLMKGVIGDEVSVNDGDSLTLHTNFTEQRADFVIEWFVDGTLICKFNKEASKSAECGLNERFKDRLKMNNQTGDLTIANITSQYAGEYKQYITDDKITSKTFSVNVSASVKVVFDGDSVSVHIDVSEKIHWKIKHKNSLVAEIMTENERVTKHETHNGFRGELKMNVHTGDLIITNMKKEDSGVYEVEVTVNNSYTIHKTFNFTGTEVNEKPVRNDGEEGKPSSSLSSGQIAGIFVVLALIVIAVVGFVIYHRCIKNPAGHKKQDENDGANIPLRNKETRNGDVP